MLNLWRLVNEFTPELDVLLDRLVDFNDRSVSVTETELAFRHHVGQDVDDLGDRQLPFPDNLRNT